MINKSNLKSADKRLHRIQMDKVREAQQGASFINVDRYNLFSCLRNSMSPR